MQTLRYLNSFGGWPHLDVTIQRCRRNVTAITGKCHSTHWSHVSTQNLVHTHMVTHVSFWQTLPRKVLEWLHWCHSCFSTSYAQWSVIVMSQHTAAVPVKWQLCWQGPVKLYLSPLSHSLPNHRPTEVMKIQTTVTITSHHSHTRCQTTHPQRWWKYRQL